MVKPSDLQVEKLLDFPPLQPLNFEARLLKLKEKIATQLANVVLDVEPQSPTTNDQNEM